MQQLAKSVIIFILLVTAFTAEGQSQPITLWGPGEGYRITYLHSGSLVKNGTTIVNFENEPTTEFTLDRVRNDGYDYTYTGYGELQLEGTITMTSFEIPSIGTIVIPLGAMPVMLPLAYGLEDDFMSAFADQIELLNQLDFSDLSTSVPKLNVSETQNYLTLSFDLSFNGNFTTNQSFFALPLLEDYDKNIQFSNGSLVGEVSYSFKTGVLFQVTYQIVGTQVDLDNSNEINQVDTSQTLSFVAIIPGSIAEDLQLDLLPVFAGVGLVVILVRKLDGILKVKRFRI